MKTILAGLAISIISFAMLSGTCAQPARSELKIIADDGRPIANRRITPEFGKAVEKLPGIVVVGNPKGDVTLAEFYDLNCPYCRRASADIDGLLRTDGKLRVILVPFPVLGIASIQAARVELAVRQFATPQQFYEFHRRIYAGRGVIDANRALAAARELKLDEARQIAAGDSDSVTETMKAHVRLGNALNLMATPSYVIQDVAIIGHPGRNALKSLIDAVRRCGKIVC
jgi:protein-disulfide isomerase